MDLSLQNHLNVCQLIEPAAISARKKILLLACFIFITACQSATPTPLAPLFPTETPLPTPIPLTDTPAPTPTIEPTGTPFPRFFTDEFDSSLAGWVILQAGNESTPNVSMENSRLLLQMDAPYTWVYALYGTQDYEGVRVETKFVNNAMSPASIGLICNYSEEDGWFEYNVSTDGTYNLLYGKWLSNGIADYLPILNGSSNAIQQSGMEQEIGLTCAKGTVALLIDGTILRNVDVSQYELAEGKVGVTASSFENTPVIVSFDWVKVSEPTPSVTP
jgi:hypothetical protein